MDLASLRSVLSTHQSFHNYPPSIPTSAVDQETNNLTNPRGSPQPQRNGMDPLRLLSKISRNGDLMSEGRPSQSLPGSPRKIRVAANLPDVGSDSPDLRYKVLTARKPRPGASTHNTPRKFPGNRNGIPRHMEGHSYGSRKPIGGPPSLSSNGSNYIEDTSDNKLLDSYEDSSSPILGHNGIHFPKSDNKNNDSENECDKSNKEISIKNTKNKLNLQFAPDKINRPRDDFDSDSLNDEEEKIAREINGNKDNDSISKEHFNGNNKQFLLDSKDDDDTSKSEESEISVLELSNFINYKENGDRQLAEATRHSSASEVSEHSSENLLSDNNYIDSGKEMLMYFSNP